MDLVPLEAQLAAAGYDVLNGIGMSSHDADTVHTYDADGQPLDLPAAAQPMIAQYIADWRAKNP